MDRRPNPRRTSPPRERSGSHRNSVDVRSKRFEPWDSVESRSNPTDSRADWQKRPERRDAPVYSNGSKYSCTDSPLRYDVRDPSRLSKDYRDETRSHRRRSSREACDAKGNEDKKETVKQVSPEAARPKQTTESPKRVEPPTTCSQSRPMNDEKDIAEPSKEDAIERLSKKPTRIFRNVLPVTTLDDDDATPLDYGDSEDDVDISEPSNTDRLHPSPTPSPPAQPVVEKLTHESRRATGHKSSSARPSASSRKESSKNEKELRDDPKAHTDIPPPWRKVWSSKGDLYYYNEETDESKWTLPEKTETHFPENSNRHDSSNKYNRQNEQNSNRIHIDSGRQSSNSRKKNDEYNVPALDNTLNNRRNTNERGMPATHNTRDRVEPRRQASFEKPGSRRRSVSTEEHANAKRARQNNDPLDSQSTSYNRYQHDRSRRSSPLPPLVRPSDERYSRQEPSHSTRHDDGRPSRPATRYPVDSRKTRNQSSERRQEPPTMRNGDRRDDRDRRDDEPRRRPYR